MTLIFDNGLLQDLTLNMIIQTQDYELIAYELSQHVKNQGEIFPKQIEDTVALVIGGECTADDKSLADIITTSNSKKYGISEKSLKINLNKVQPTKVLNFVLCRDPENGKAATLAKKQKDSIDRFGLDGLIELIVLWQYGKDNVFHISFYEEVMHDYSSGPDSRETLTRQDAKASREQTCLKRKRTYDLRDFTHVQIKVEHKKKTIEQLRADYANRESGSVRVVELYRK